MWEVRAHPEGLTDLLSWICEVALTAFEVNPLHINSEVFSDTENRVVVISKWRSEPHPLADPPPALVARSPHVWDFTQVDR